MKSIMLNGAEHIVDPFLDGFIIGVTPQSSNVALFGINTDKGELFVKFRNGSQYLYNPVDMQTLHDALRAESIGKFIARNVVKKFESTKVEKELFTAVDPTKVKK